MDLKNLFLVAAVLFFASYAFAEESPIYAGNISIDSIFASAVINDAGSNAVLEVEYNLKNTANSEESVDLGFLVSGTELKINGAQISNPVSFSADEEKTLTAKYNVEVAGDHSKTFSFNPLALTFSGKMNAKRVNSFFADVALPKSVNKIILASKEPYSHETDESGIVHYIWQANDSYPTTLTVKFSTLGIDLTAEKEVSPERITEENQILTIKITLQNNGNAELQNILIMDDYTPAEFEAVSPAEEFSIPDLNSSDPRLWWTKKIDSLGVGEMVSFSYSVKYIGDVSRVYDMKMSSSLITVNGHLAAVSNEPLVSKMVGVKEVIPEQKQGEEQKKESEQPPVKTQEEFPSMLLLLGISAIVVIAAAAFFIMRGLITKKRN